MDPTGKGPDALQQGGSAASNAAAPDPSNSDVPDENMAANPPVDKTVVPAVNKAAAPVANKAAAPVAKKAAVPGVNKAAVPAVNKAAFSAVNKAAVPAVNKAAASAVNKAAALAVNKAAVPAVNKAAFSAVNKAAVPAVNKAAVPAVNKASVPAVNKAAVSAVNKAAVPAVNKAAFSAVNKTAVPAVNKAAAPAPKKVAASDLNTVAAPDLSQVASTDASKVFAPDSSKAVAPDSSKVVEAAVAGEPSKNVGGGPTKVGKSSGTPWLKLCQLVGFAHFLACNAALAIHGLCVFVRGLVRFVDTRRKFSNPQATTTETTNGIISIILGSVAVVVGSFGLFCTLMKNRILSIANLVVLFLSTLGCVIFICLYVKDTADFVAEERASTREGMVNLYDLSVVRESRQFTAAIDRIQQKNKCCGWAGPDGENIFLKTPWFKKVNFNLSSQSLQFLPRSCCSTTTLDCLSFKDMKAAREKKVIHGRDCWHMIAEEFNTVFNGVLIELIAASVIQALCIVSPITSYACIGIQLLRSRFANRSVSPKK